MRVGRLEASINELMADVGEAREGAEDAGAVAELPAPKVSSLTKASCQSGDSVSYRTKFCITHL